jgi:hypothetical protein
VGKEGGGHINATVRFINISMKLTGMLKKSNFTNHYRKDFVEVEKFMQASWKAEKEKRNSLILQVKPMNRPEIGKYMGMRVHITFGENYLDISSQWYPKHPTLYPGEDDFSSAEISIRYSDIRLVQIDENVFYGGKNAHGKCVK